MDSVWEQKKLEASLPCCLAPACSRHERWRGARPGKMLEKPHRTPASSAPKKIAGDHFTRENIALFRQEARKSGSFLKIRRIFHGFQVTF